VRIWIAFRQHKINLEPLTRWPGEKDQFQDEEWDQRGVAVTAYGEKVHDNPPDALQMIGERVLPALR
jgi:hypothetical protein